MAFRRWIGRSASLLPVCCLPFTACGSDGSSSDGSGGGSGSSGSVSVGDSGSAASGGGGDGSSCAGEIVEAELVPLDVYVMLDKSSSMTEATAAGVSKWDAVGQALRTFLEDDASAGLGVGLQFFPIQQPGVPTTCTSDAACGAAGPCVGLCWNTLLAGSNVVCAADTDCPADDTCEVFGHCANDPTYTCALAGGGQCGLEGDVDLGACVVDSFCLFATSCEVAPYATPAVPIDVLPVAAPALIAAIDAAELASDTPTRVALEGAIEHARAHAAATPGRRAVVLLATDGLPTACEPFAAGALRTVTAAGFTGQPSVPTFAIGVFGPADRDVGRAVLDFVAVAGGTGAAIVVDTERDVTEQFLSALNRVRSRLQCELQIPDSPSGQTLDYGRVNVDFTSASGETTRLPYVADAASCVAAGGWYYDVDPATGAIPSTISVCESTCNAFQSGGQVEVRVGCVTVTPIE